MNNIIKAIKNTNGKLFSIKYSKKDGTVTNMTCRLGVVTPLKGGTSNATEDQITVFSFDRNGYRALYKENILEFKCGSTILLK